MKCVIVKENGDAEKLKIVEMDIPKREKEQLLIKVFVQQSIEQI